MLAPMVAGAAAGLAICCARADHPPLGSAPVESAATSTAVARAGERRASGGAAKIHGQIVSRRKLAKDLIFFDVRSVAGEVGGEAGTVFPAGELVEMVVSGREGGADAETVQLARSLRQGDVVCAVAELEVGSSAEAAALGGSVPPKVLRARSLRVVNRWADLNGQTSFASTLVSGSGQSQRSKSKRGRKAVHRARTAQDGGENLPAKTEERTGSKHRGVKTRRRKRHLELCRALVQRVSSHGGNSERLRYSDGICGQSSALAESGKPATVAIQLGGADGDRATIAINVATSEAKPVAGRRRIDWSQMPPSLDPAADDEDGSVQSGKSATARTRAARKRWQVESVYIALLTLVDALAPLGPHPMEAVRQRLRVVDFGSGAGNATLAVAWLLRARCSFVLLDMKPVASELANRRVGRVEGLGQVVSSVIGRIEDYSEPFDIGVAVHACGLATDCAQLQCIARSAPYLLVPCCVGKLNNDVKINSPYSLPQPTTDAAWRRGTDSSGKTSFTIHQQRPKPAPAPVRRQNPGLPAGTDAPSGGESGAMPRSSWLQSQLREPEEWSALVSIANHNAYDFDVTTGDVAVRRLGKTILEADRNQVAREMGYRAVLGKLEPLEASPMNDVLVGWPRRFAVSFVDAADGHACTS